MAMHNSTSNKLKYTLPRYASKPSYDAKLDKVFQMAEHVDARYFYMFDTSSSRRRHTLAVR